MCLCSRAGFEAARESRNDRVSERARRCVFGAQADQLKDARSTVVWGVAKLECVPARGQVRNLQDASINTMNWQDAQGRTASRATRRASRAERAGAAEGARWLCPISARVSEAASPTARATLSPNSIGARLRDRKERGSRHDRTALPSRHE